jgi:glycosyltransferase involved in cell wall biosynthesis
MVTPEYNGADVVFANQYGYAMGYEPLLMSKLYSSMDVLTSVTMGEGFGIPLIEAQACGTPVIIGDWSSMSELCFSGWKVLREEAEPMFTPLNAYHYFPHMGAIAERMEAAYQMRGNQDYRKRAKAGAQAYDIERVFNSYMLPMIGRAEEKLKQSGSVQMEQKLDVLR